MGKLSYGSMVWQKGMPDWAPIERTELRRDLEEAQIQKAIDVLINERDIFLTSSVCIKKAIKYFHGPQDGVFLG